MRIIILGLCVLGVIGGIFLYKRIGVFMTFQRNNTIKLENFDLRYDDLQKEILPFGLDYDHLRLSKLNLEVGKLTLKDDVVAFSINNLSFMCLSPLR